MWPIGLRHSIWDSHLILPRCLAPVPEAGVGRASARLVTSHDHAVVVLDWLHLEAGPRLVGFVVLIKNVVA